MSLTIGMSLLAYVLINSFTPGPGNILALNTMTRYGWKKGRYVFFGICAGYLAVQIICIAGIYGMSRYLSDALVWLKYIGCFYLVWLAVHILRSKPDFEENEDIPSFLSGFLLQFVNVKIYFYGLTFLNGYVLPYNSHLYGMVISEIIITAIGCIATFCWGWMGLKLKKIYIKYYTMFNFVFAMFLILCALSLLFK